MTSTLDVAETQPAPAKSRRTTAFVVCSGLLGCAAPLVVELVAIKAADATNPHWGAIVTVWFFGGLIGFFVGMMLASLCLDHRPALADTLAPLVCALSLLAVPFLLYMAFAMLAVSVLEGSS